jgi:hypothetical protein
MLPMLERMTFAEKIVWRVLFWSGLFSMIAGTGFANSFINNAVQGQSYLIGGFAFIVLGIALVATGYLVYLGRIRIQRNKETKQNPS